MSLAAKQEFLRRQVEQGILDFSEHASVSNAAPGVLIRTHTVNCEVRVTDVVIYNADAGAAVITLYDEDSNVRLVVSVGAGAFDEDTIHLTDCWDRLICELCECTTRSARSKD